MSSYYFIAVIFGASFALIQNKPLQAIPAQTSNCTSSVSSVTVTQQSYGTDGSGLTYNATISTVWVCTAGTNPVWCAICVYAQTTSSTSSNGPWTDVGQGASLQSTSSCGSTTTNVYAWTVGPLVANTFYKTYFSAAPTVVVNGPGGTSVQCDGNPDNYTTTSVTYAGPVTPVTNPAPPPGNPGP